jgi:UDP-glucose 4-epimerase
MKWLVTGGAGYIGSHVAQKLLESGEEVVVFDNFSNGNRRRLAEDVHVISGDIRDTDAIKKTIIKESITGIMHLAALKSPGDSFLNPDEYNDVNVNGTRTILSTAIQRNVQWFIQSSTAAIYGDKNTNPVKENGKLKPISPYGKTKLDAELLLNNAIGESQIIGCSLRFFNVVGSIDTNKRDSSELNLFPSIIRSIETGQAFQIYGNKYETPDGTCIRDYVHVADIANAHVHAAKSLQVKELPNTMNIGTGKGHSVLEIIDKFSKINGTKINYEICDGRVGDSPSVVADVELAASVMDFHTQYDLERMVSDTLFFR